MRTLGVPLSPERIPDFSVSPRDVLSEAHLTPALMVTTSLTVPLPILLQSHSAGPRLERGGKGLWEMECRGHKYNFKVTRKPGAGSLRLDKGSLKRDHAYNPEDRRDHSAVSDPTSGRLTADAACSPHFSGSQMMVSIAQEHRKPWKVVERLGPWIWTCFTSFVIDSGNDSTLLKASLRTFWNGNVNTSLRQVT